MINDLTRTFTVDDVSLAWDRWGHAYHSSQLTHAEAWTTALEAHLARVG